MNSSQQPHIEAEDQIDIIALISKVWAGRKFVIKSAVIAAVIGVLVAILTPNTYTASSMFTPNSSGGSSGGSSGLKGLASLAGINIGSSMEGAKEISPMLYGKILESYTFKKELLEAPLKNLGKVTSLEIFLNKKLLLLFFWNSKRVHYWLAIKNYWMVQI